MPDRREMPACALGKIPQGLTPNHVLLETPNLLYSIPAPAQPLSIHGLFPGEFLGVPSPLGPFSSLLNSAPSQYPEARRMTPLDLSLPEPGPK